MLFLSEIGIPVSSEISDVRWSADMHGPVTRKLVNESHSMY